MSLTGGSRRESDTPNLRRANIMFQRQTVAGLALEAQPAPEGPQMQLQPVCLPSFLGGQADQHVDAAKSPMPSHGSTFGSEALRSIIACQLVER